MDHAVERRQTGVVPPRVDARAVPLHLDVQLFSSGLGAGITRSPGCHIAAQPLIAAPRLLPPWQPNWPTLKSIGVRFPDARLAESDGPETEPAFDAIGGGLLSSPRTSTSARPPKDDAHTRVSVPTDALSISDRLFYLLQPPIDPLLSGQELLMPFEPFPFQYQGIAWLFSQGSALLADEMGLGKTMQAISALRLLMRAGQIRTVLLICPKPLITNWQRELQMWAEELPVIAIEGPSRRRRMLWEMPNVPVKVANYELLVRDLEMIGEDDFPPLRSPYSGRSPTDQES